MKTILVRNSLFNCCLSVFDLEKVIDVFASLFNNSIYSIPLVIET